MSKRKNMILKKIKNNIQENVENMNKKSIKKAAFTLAETLLTLVIIGVVMALMLRSISRVNPDKDKILFLKSYHAIETAIGNSINDGTKYDQNTDENADFGNVPLATAKATINGTSYCTSSFQSTTTDTCNNKSITANNAVCYWLADQINFVGGFSCASGASTLNFRSTSGVCFYGWATGPGTVTGKVDPNCENKGYSVTVYKDGRVTVPSGSDAYRWVQEQTQIKN